MPRMNPIPILALMLAPNPPLPINDMQMRDIGCVAALGIIAHEQQEEGEARRNFPDLRESGKRWAGIVGQRVMDETGQPREVVAFAIKQAVEAEQVGAMKANDPVAHVRSRVTACKSVMDAQLATADSNTPAAETDDSPSMLSPEQQWGTDEPDKIALYREQLMQDQSDPQRVSYCHSLVEVSHREVADREGKDSRDAQGLARLVAALSARKATLVQVKPLKPVNDAELVAELARNPGGEEKIMRCLRLGESLALAMPPE